MVSRLRLSWIIPLIVGALFVFTATTAILESREALEFRQTRNAATRLELAAHTLSMIELISEPPAGVGWEEVDAVALLEDEGAFDGTGLSDTDRARAVELTALLTENAVIDSQTNRADIEELLQILHADAVMAEERGMEAESSAFVYFVLSAMTGTAVVLLVMNAQRRERKLRRSLHHEAHTDSLTGLANRRELAYCIEMAQQDIESTGRHVAMLYMDLDGFKAINDAGGHVAGDEILRVVARKLEAVQAPGETLVRLGGDEFGVLAHGLRSSDDALEMAERYRRCLNNGPGTTEVLRISIGVATAATAGDIADVQKHANLAMYEAKKRQGSTVALYEDGLSEAAHTTSAILQALRSADLDDEFNLEYQPIVEIHGDVFFVEALVRWNSPLLGRVRPDEFISLAESNGEIIRIGDWVIRSAFKQLERWKDDPLMNELSISVNVSIYELEDEDFISRLRSAAATVEGIDTSKLIIEVTESSATGRLVMDQLANIQELGYRVAIDDFGSGYSNLAQLIHTPFDILKVDRGLITSLEEFDEHGERSIEVLSAVSAIAGAQDAPVVCEGVEEEHQLQPLLDAGISHIQGWLISKSVPPSELREFLEGREALADRVPSALAA